MTFTHEKHKYIVFPIPKDKDIGKGLLSRIRRETCLTNHDEFERVMRKKMSREQYLAILQREEVLQKDHPQ